MATKYKVKNTNKNSTKARTGKEEPFIGKGKILLLLILGTLVIAGVYIVAISMQFAPIFHIYWILTAILFCRISVSETKTGFVLSESIGHRKTR